MFDRRRNWNSDLGVGAPSPKDTEKSEPQSAVNSTSTVMQSVGERLADPTSHLSEEERELALHSEVEAERFQIG